MKQPRKIYAPVTDFERATSYCPRKASNFAEASMDRSPRCRPLYLAWRILDEARDYFRTSWVPSPGSATLTRCARSLGPRGPLLRKFLSPLPKRLKSPIR
jgi:hypothetical protein